MPTLRPNLLEGFTVISSLDCHNPALYRYRCKRACLSGGATSKHMCRRYSIWTYLNVFRHPETISASYAYWVQMGRGKILPRHSWKILWSYCFFVFFCFPRVFLLFVTPSSRWELPDPKNKQLEYIKPRNNNKHKTKPPSLWRKSWAQIFLRILCFFCRMV